MLEHYTSLCHHFYKAGDTNAKIATNVDSMVISNTVGSHTAPAAAAAEIAGVAVPLSRAAGVDHRGANHRTAAAAAAPNADEAQSHDARYILGLRLHQLSGREGGRHPD